MGTTNLDILKLGTVVFPPYSSDPGLEITSPIFYDFGAIAAPTRNGLVSSVDPANNATLTLKATTTGMTNTGGVITLDNARNVTIYSASDQSTKTLLVTGTDFWGQAQTEVITGPNGSTTTKMSAGKKAFKTISSLVATGDFGTIEVGFGAKLGLPFRIDKLNKAEFFIDGKVAAPHTLNAIITAIGTAQNTAVLDTIGGKVVEASGVSAAANGTASSIVTITNPASLQGSTVMGTITFTSAYSANVLQASGALTSVDLPSDAILTVVTDGGGDGAGQAVISIEVDPAVAIVADDTSPATTTTGDVRGTVDFGLIPNATKLFSMKFNAPYRDTVANAFGVTPI